MTSPPTDKGAVREVTSRVVSVVVMEDRAQVTRRATVALGAGRVLLEAGGVTPLVADRSLRCRLLANNILLDERQGRVLDLRVERSYVVRAARPERERELVAAIDAAAAEHRGAHDRIRTLLHERQLLAGVGEVMAQQVSHRLAIGAFDASAKAEVTLLAARRAELDTQALALQQEQEDREKHIEALHEELALALAPVTDYQATLAAELSLAVPGTYNIEWEYLIPCALWRPEYTAELLDESAKPRVRWTSGGTVWQRTGEDWNDVEVSLSTARPTLGAELPLLSDDLLRARPKSDEEKRVITVASRDEEIAVASGVAQARQVDTPPGVDDGGEARTFRVPHPVSVPSDGRPHRLAFETWEAPAECELVTMPSRAAYVFLRSLQTNPSASPLLAGPVELLRRGGFIGRSEVAYVAPQERFELSWGTEDHLVVLRDMTRKLHETKLKKTQEHGFKVKIYLANHTSSPAAVRLVERVPVSEISEVKSEILAKETTAGFAKDDQGLITWKLKLPPRGEERVELGFEVSMPANVQWNG